MKIFNQIVSEIFKIPEGNITDDLSSKTIPEWDSMNYLLFIAELEKQFNVSFSMDEVMNADSLGTIKTILKSKGAQI
ncbi:MAG: acyl carrier protein [Candidatus Azambacteria bacterium]|nr:acyl carrier protein [Candidatus Azambacteria bacterium]